MWGAAPAARNSESHGFVTEAQSAQSFGPNSHMGADVAWSYTRRCHPTVPSSGQSSMYVHARRVGGAVPGAIPNLKVLLHLVRKQQPGRPFRMRVADSAHANLHSSPCSSLPGRLILIKKSWKPSHACSVDVTKFSMENPNYFF